MICHQDLKEEAKQSALPIDDSDAPQLAAAAAAADEVLPMSAPQECVQTNVESTETESSVDG